MQTVRKNAIDISPSQFGSGFPKAPVSPDQEKKLKIREFMSWSACFAVVCGLTGLLMILKVGITMNTVTSTLFYLSLGGLIYFVTRIILISRIPVHLHSNKLHELN
jgi:predicted membrane channel-forming protein YqfA (hemolysin III family)